MKQEIKEEKKNLKVGDILHYSWGYDQTQCEFYQVVNRIGKATVEIREIVSETVPGSEGFMCENRMPVKDRFLEKAPFIKKRIRWFGTTSCVRMDYGSAMFWDGKQQYCS